MRYSRIFRNSCSEIFTRSPPPASARVGGKWLVVSPVPHIISFPGSSLHFAPNSSLRTGCPYTTILERSPGSGAVQNRRADVARNTLPSSWTFRRGTSRASPAAVLATAPGRFHNCNPHPLRLQVRLQPTMTVAGCKERELARSTMIAVLIRR